MFRKKVIIACYSKDSRQRLITILTQYGLQSKIINNFKDFLSNESDYIALVLSQIKFGFETENFIFITEQNLFGEKILLNTKNEKSIERILREENNLIIGDFVIHRDYGLGKFVKLESINLANIKKDYLKIEYANKANLFIPIEDFDLITKYGRDINVGLDNLGSNKWIIKKNKVKEKLDAIAKDLIKIASFRELSTAPILVANDNLYKEFCSNFKYVETPDQMQAIIDVENDLLTGHPCDRLICGDVGFGKTEIALRASFIAVSSEKNAVQVAIIAPTTLLCKQHYLLFLERFAFTDIKIAMLSRLTTASENKKIKSQLENGTINIVIGTHSLLSDNLKFKNLGLLIVDEEQRFGVIQKEKLKQLSSGIHLLTLSATPIPRTLQMSMIGIRSLSLITTPPINRLNVNTYLMIFDNIIIEEAIKREINRNGKVIIVVPRISDIIQIQTALKNTLKNISHNIVNGQMSSNLLDKTINDFYNGKFSILISTTIVENGLDIPRANTIIIYKANNFGLSQLHQLRGRVGRSSEKAYAYFTTNATDSISDNARKRLKAIETIQNIGSGFEIASNDMEIRGSGNIIGKEQSGHVKEVGTELYNSMLSDSINKIKEKKNFKTESYDFSPCIKLNISTTIDASYINDINLRLYYYKKLANIQNIEEKTLICQELENRFGKIPIEIQNILHITNIKNLCKICNILKLELINSFIEISFYNEYYSNPNYLLKLIQDKKAIMKKQNVLNFFIDKNNIFDNVKNILMNLIQNMLITC